MDVWATWVYVRDQGSGEVSTQEIIFSGSAISTWEQMESWIEFHGIFLLRNTTISLAKASHVAEPKVKGTGSIYSATSGKNFKVTWKRAWVKGWNLGPIDLPYRIQNCHNYLKAKHCRGGLTFWEYLVYCSFTFRTVKHLWDEWNWKLHASLTAWKWYDSEWRFWNSILLSSTYFLWALPTLFQLLWAYFAQM